jgi:hypothetical protein
MLGRSLEVSIHLQKSEVIYMDWYYYAFVPSPNVFVHSIY